MASFGAPVREGVHVVTTTAAADATLASLLARIDAFIACENPEAPPTPPFEPHCLGFARADTECRSPGRA